LIFLTDKSMKAILYQKYGPPEVLQLKEIEKPTPKDDEILIKVFATTVSRGDVRMRSFNVPRAHWLFARLYLGVFKPRRSILGMSLAGEVEAIGKNVTLYKKGDPVFASTFGTDFGGYAEYKCMPQNGMVFIKPTNSSWHEAAAIIGGSTTALRLLRKGNVEKGKDVLVYGASGAVGTYAVQLARYFGANVTAVCSTSNVELVQSIGALKTIDYTQNDFTSCGETYDLVLDGVGLTSSSQCKRLLRKSGKYINVHDPAGHSGEKKEEYLFIKDLVERGKVKPVIDRIYKLKEIVEAHRYVDKGHKKGNVAVSVND
jgi:NADPH:quinone reductase-like Zn-dependent oxidoreductase